MSLRSLARTLLPIVVACAVLLPLPSLQAQQPGLVESFDDPALPGWERSPNAVVEDGTLRIAGQGFAFRGGWWSDLVLSLRARLRGEGCLYIGYRARDEGSYGLRLYGDRAALYRLDAELAGAPLPAPAGDWLEVEVRVEGGSHTLLVNGSLLLTADDPAPLPPGGVMLRVEGEAEGRFDDLIVSPVGSAAPPTAEEAAAPPATTAVVAEPPPSGARLPAHQALPWVRTGGPIGGLGYDIHYNPADHRLWYVTDAWSGFHLSTDNGLTWTPSNQGITSRKGLDGIPIFCATVDPHNPQTIWIGTDLTGDIYRSTDGGHSWVEMDNGVDPELRPLSFRGFTVDPRTSDIVYAMAEIGSPGWTPDRSQRVGLEMDLTQGIVYKTTDGGRNWVEIWRGDNLARYLWIDPRDPEVLYVSTGIFDREAANTSVKDDFAGGVGILKSTDGGRTWRVLNEANGLLDLYVGSLYMHPENPDALLAAAAQNNWSSRHGRDTAGVYLTEDGGERWTRVLSGELFSGVEYCTCDPNVAYAASAQAVHRSDDGGRTWQRFSRPNDTWGPPGIVAGFPIDLQCDPVDPRRVFVNNYLGGNFLSADGGQSWVLASKGYTGELVRNLAVVPGRPGTVFAGSRSGVFRTEDGGEEWVGLVYPPEGMQFKLNEISALAVDPSDPNHLLALPTDLAAVLYSHDGGASWQVAQKGLGNLNSLRFAPSDPSIVYAASTSMDCINPQGLASPMLGCQGSELGVYLSHDGGMSWTQVDSSPVSRGVQVAALAVHPHDAHTVYVSLPGAGVYRSDDGGQTWAPASAGLPTQLAVLGLAIDPTRPEILFAGLGTSETAPWGGGVYRSDDGGQSWAQSNAGLHPEALVRSIVVDPTDGDVVYAADRFSGVCVSLDGGRSWRQINEGLTHRDVNVLALSDDGTVLYAGVEGDGVYRLGVPPPGEPWQPPPSELAQPQPATATAVPAATARPEPTAVPSGRPSSPAVVRALPTGLVPWLGGAVIIALLAAGAWLWWRKR